MSKGTETKQRIIREAAVLASATGLDQITIGSLANHLQMSKSGLFTHFGSREDLQIDVVRQIVRDFSDEVVVPALSLPAGRDQVLALMRGILDWSYVDQDRKPGGCPLASAAFEFDHDDSRLHALIAKSWGKWRDVLEQAIEQAQATDLSTDIDPKQTAMDLTGLYFSHHIYHWLLNEPSAREWIDARLEEALPAKVI